MGCGRTQQTRGNVGGASWGIENSPPKQFHLAEQSPSALAIAFPVSSRNAAKRSDVISISSLSHLSQSLCIAFKTSSSSGAAAIRRAQASASWSLSVSGAAYTSAILVPSAPTTITYSDCMSIFHGAAVCADDVVLAVFAIEMGEVESPIGHPCGPHHEASPSKVESRSDF